MKFLTLPFKLIQGIWNSISNVLYRIRDIMWAYPELFLEENPRRDNIAKIYQSAAPYSHFVASISIMFLLLVPFVFGGIPKVISGTGSQLLEGVVMGVDENGNVQQLSKVNPIFPSNIQLEKDLVELIYEPLLRFNYVPFEDGELIGGVEFVLAKEVSTITPGADYIFTLREGVFWHDHDERINPHELTTDDVIATVDLLASLDIDISTTRAVKQLQWEKLDKYRIRICTKEDNAEGKSCAEMSNKPIFSNFLELISFKVLPASDISDIDNTTVNTSKPDIYKSPIGTGKYKFDGASTEGINLKKNTNYYTSNLIKNSTADLNRLMDEEVDLLSSQENLEIIDEIIGNYELIAEPEITISSVDYELSLVLNTEDDGLIIEDYEINELDSINQIRFIYYRDIESSINALKNAEVHAVATSSVGFRNDLRNFTQIKTTLSPILYNQFWALYFNLRVKPDSTSIGPSFLLDQNVRKAIAFSIDKESIIRDALKDVGVPSKGPIPEISYYFNDGADIPKYNIATAEQLFEQAGWTVKEGDFYRTDKDGNIMSFSMSFVESFDRRQVVEAMKSDLSKVGVEVFTHRELENLPDYFTDINIRKAIANHLSESSRVQSVVSDNPEEVSRIKVAEFLAEQSELFSSVNINVDQTLNDNGWLLSADGFRYNDDRIMSLDLNFVDSEANREIAKAFTDSLKEIGIQVNLNYLSNTEESSWSLQDLNDQLLAPRLFDTILYGMNRFIDPEMYELYHSSQSADPGLNISSFESKEITVERRENRQEGESSLVQVPKVDKFLEQARSFDPVNNRDDRKEKYDDVQRIIAEEVPLIYIYHPQFLYYSNNAVENVDLSFSKSIEERFRNIERWSVQ